jgi:hypothetical protein
MINLRVAADAIALSEPPDNRGSPWPDMSCVERYDLPRMLSKKASKTSVSGREKLPVGGH